MSATVTSVTVPVFDQGLQRIKFFNGRLLSGEDLTTEQAANRHLLDRAGRAVGDGVVFGLEVSLQTGTTTPTVTVQPGVAFNRDGQSVRLGKATNVGLYAPSAPAANTGTVTPFTSCGPSAPGIYLSATDAYLLTIAPAAGTSGVAPVLGLSDGTDKCNAKYLVEGAQFGLIQLHAQQSDLISNAVQNLVAARCFGFGSDPLVDPFSASLPAQGTPGPQGLIEALRGGALTNGEVPLAVIGWTVGTGITFVDMWSARRRVGRPDNADDAIFPITDRYTSLREAVFLQFQSQLALALGGAYGPPASLIASSAFQYLPPVGLLPLSTAAFPTGIVPQTFFQNNTVRGPIAIEGARAEAMIRDSLRYPQIDLQSGEMVWLFQTRQNMQAAAAQSNPARPYVFFVTGQMPYYGDSRYNAAYFDFDAWT